ncbi:MAG: hypothetical protein JWO38_2358 [Gemmataceae bacterium]|nr:hypothetical protein [Gemmataceae bacterium]
MTGHREGIRTGAPTIGMPDASHTVHYRKGQFGRAHAAEAEVPAGPNPGETATVHPGDGLPEGTVVEPVPPPAR